MGMFDSMIDARGREWQTKAFGRTLERWRIGDRVPADDADFQAKVIGDEAFGYEYALVTVRGGVLTEVPAERDPQLLLVDYGGGYLEVPVAVELAQTSSAATRARLNALLILLTNSGDITPMGARQIERTLDAEGITT